MNKFKLGTNFDIELLDKIAEQNELHADAKVTELYGSIRKHSALAARPDFRLPDVSEKELEQYIQLALDRNIKFEYTFNSINPYGSRVELAKHVKDIKTLVTQLYNMGVYRVSIANPMLLEVISDVNTHPEIEISTVAHIDTVTQIKYYHDVYGATKVCANLNKNRDFKWLSAASKWCRENGVELELMANEFCGVGNDTYATHCVYRDSCYICHSTDKTEDDAKLINWYPMRFCTRGRNANPANWLKMRFIRPEDLIEYNRIGINMFKLTGRTGSTEYIMKMLKAYMNCEWHENLLGLWKPLESIIHDKSEDFTAYDIPNDKLDGFITYFVQGHCCDNEVCGETCKYCDKFYERHIK